MNTQNKDTFPPIITDRYEIISLLGEGGMSRVYLAQDKQLPRKIAIKSILSELSEKQEVKKRIEREVQTHASIGPHANIVTLFDKIEQSGRTYLIMEYVEGETLDSWAKNHDYTQEQMVSIIADILNALKTIHARNVIHRDIKPENIMVSASEAGHITAKLMDFGISYDEKLSTSATKLTQIDVGTPGSPAYMSPEQIDSKTFGEVGPASDLYSVGIIFYELLTKTPPFTGTMTQILTGHLVTVPDVENINFQSLFLKTVLLKALAKKQQERYTTAEAFLADLTTKQQTNLHKDKTQLAVKLDTEETANKTQLHVPTQNKSSSGNAWLPIILIVGIGVAGAAYYLNTTKQQPVTATTEVVEKPDDELVTSSQEPDIPESELQDSNTDNVENVVTVHNATEQQKDELTESDLDTPLIETGDLSTNSNSIDSSDIQVTTIDPYNYLGPKPADSDSNTSTQAADAFKALREKRREQVSTVSSTQTTTTHKASVQKTATKATQTNVTKKTTTTANKSSTQSQSSSSSGWTVTGSSSNKVN